MNVSDDILGAWIFVVSSVVIPYICWQIASIRDELRQVLEQLKEQK